jgi:hypothetical protein
MDKDFWLALRENKFNIPEGYDLPALTEELFSYLGSTDPELRDTIAYETFGNWLEQERYTADQLRGYVLRLLINLQEGVGETESDSLFLRAFSVLFLAEIVDADNRHPFLDADEVRNILSKGLAYLDTEADPRGYVQDKGWGHALAHTADLLFVLARNRHLHAEDLTRILDGIATKMTGSDYWIYVHGEDDRLVRAAMTALQRDLLSEQTVQAWLNAMVSPAEASWKGAWADENRTAAFFNTRNFLRSLALRVCNSSELAHKEKLQGMVMEATANLRYF